MVFNFFASTRPWFDSVDWTLVSIVYSPMPCILKIISTVTSKRDAQPASAPPLALNKTLVHYRSPPASMHAAFPPLHPSSTWRVRTLLAHHLLGLLHGLGDSALCLLGSERLLPSAKVPVLQVSVSLGELRRAVDEVAAEEEVVLGRHGEGVAHEDGRVDGQSTRHLSGDTVDLLAYLFE